MSAQMIRRAAWTALAFIIALVPAACDNRPRPTTASASPTPPTSAGTSASISTPVPTATSAPPTPRCVRLATARAQAKWLREATLVVSVSQAEMTLEVNSENACKPFMVRLDIYRVTFHTRFNNGVRTSFTPKFIRGGARRYDGSHAMHLQLPTVKTGSCQSVMTVVRTGRSARRIDDVAGSIYREASLPVPQFPNPAMPGSGSALEPPRVTFVGHHGPRFVRADVSLPRGTISC